MSPFGMPKEMGGDSPENVSWMERCVTSVMEKSKRPKDSAIAICKAQFMKMHSKKSNVGESAVWTTAYINDLPDSAFLYIESGGDKDEDGKTKPRSLRHFPYKDKEGKVDLPHLRNAIARIPQSSLPADVKERVQAKARKLLGGQNAAYEEPIIIDYDIMNDVIQKINFSIRTLMLQGNTFSAAKILTHDLLARANYDMNVFKSLVDNIRRS